MKKGCGYTHPALLISVLLIPIGCASPGRSMGVGALVGGLGGATVGAIADPGRHGENRFRNVVIGTAVGGVLGAGTGFIADRLVKDERDEATKNEKEAATREAESHATAPNGMEPRLLPARTEARWVPDQIRGTVFVPGHFEYIIIEGARWETGR